VLEFSLIFAWRCSKLVNTAKLLLISNSEPNDVKCSLCFDDLATEELKCAPL